MKRKNLLFLCFCLSLFLSGCSPHPTEALDGQPWNEEWTQVGTVLGVETPRQLTLLDNKDILAADGLYYATWTAGAPAPYENSDGDIIDLYDAQLYLLSSETPDEKTAEQDYQTWLASAKENYRVLEEETITCNGQSYTLITYDCISEDSPYDHGVSALGVCGSIAVCAELTCVEGYDEDLIALLTAFLNGCHYSTHVQDQK